MQVRPVSNVTVTFPVEFTASEKDTLISMTSPVVYAPFAFVDETSVIVGRLVSAMEVSIKIALFAAKLVAGEKLVKALPAASRRILAIEVVVRSLDASSACTM